MRFALAFAAVASLLLFSCSEKKEQFETELLTEYVAPQPGKYITYRTDSMVFTNFGRNTEIHKYQEKHVIDALITDNLGRPAYRVFRYFRDSTDAFSWTEAQPWEPGGSYIITILPDQVEVTEDNLRFIKMHLPMREGFSWKGNKFLPADPYSTLYNFSNDDNMADWDYYFDSFNSGFSHAGQNYTNVWSIEAADEAYNVPITDVNAYAAKSRAVEKYAKGIGLVYREYELWEYQPNTGGSGGPYKTGFGVTMWMIDHN